MSNTQGSDVREALSEDQWLELAERHALSDWDCAEPDGFLNAVKALCADFAALSHPAPSHPATTAGGWLPIETAPRDGTEVWAFNGEQGVMHWIEGEGYALWVWADMTLCDVDPSPEQPTHYMPKPADPPAITNTGGTE